MRALGGQGTGRSLLLGEPPRRDQFSSRVRPASIGHERVVAAPVEVGEEFVDGWFWKWLLS